MQLYQALALARELVRRHGLSGWTVVLDDAKTRAGVCRPGRKQIGLSRPLTLLHTDAEVRDTILHEIAHALAGAVHGHDAVWQAQARELGCAATRCMTSENGRLEGAWRGTCPAGHVSTRHRRPERVQSCGICSSTFDPDALLSWTYRGRRVPMHPAYVAEVAAIAARRQPTAAAAAGTAVAAPAAQPVRRILPPGTRVRLLGSGGYAGLTGTVVKFGRTRYQVKTRAGLVSAPVVLVQAL